MTRMNPDHQEQRAARDADEPPLFNELDELGERAVRLNIARNVYGPAKRPLVDEWLRRRAEDRAEASARRASASAWIAVGAAVVSALAAIVGLYIG